MAMTDAKPLDARVAVVTGAARGIGRAACVALAHAGASVAGIDACGVVSARNEYAPSSPEELEETGRMVCEAGAAWLPIRCDQRDIDAVRGAAEQVRLGLGGVDIVFANAGIQAFVPLLEMEDADWHDTIDTNLSGTANLIRVFAPLLVSRGGG